MAGSAAERKGRPCAAEAPSAWRRREEAAAFLKQLQASFAGCADRPGWRPQHQPAEPAARSAGGARRAACRGAASAAWAAPGRRRLPGRSATAPPRCTSLAAPPPRTDLEGWGAPWVSDTVAAAGEEGWAHVAATSCMASCCRAVELQCAALADARAKSGPFPTRHAGVQITSAVRALLALLGIRADSELKLNLQKPAYVVGDLLDAPALSGRPHCAGLHAGSCTAPRRCAGRQPLQLARHRLAILAVARKLSLPVVVAAVGSVPALLLEVLEGTGLPGKRAAGSGAAPVGCGRRSSRGGSRAVSIPPSMPSSSMCSVARCQATTASAAARGPAGRLRAAFL